MADPDQTPLPRPLCPHGFDPFVRDGCAAPPCPGCVAEALDEGLQILRQQQIQGQGETRQLLQDLTGRVDLVAGQIGQLQATLAPRKAAPRVDVLRDELDQMRERLLRVETAQLRGTWRWRCSDLLLTLATRVRSGVWPPKAKGAT